MVTFNKNEYVTLGKYYREGHCLSTDNKPTSSDMANGSTLIEMNTGKIYMFNEASETWVEWE